MQIPRSVLDTLSAKGKGYVEAAMKLAEGQRLINEATLEIAALDGKKINEHKGVLNNAGGDIVTNTVRDLAKPRITPEYLKTFLKDGPLSARTLAERVNCSVGRLLDVLRETEGVGKVGKGSKTLWTLAPESGRITTKAATANKTKRRSTEHSSDFGDQAPRCKLALEAIQKDPWMNTSRIAKEVLGHHEFAVEVCRALEKADMIWKVKKAGNPAHGAIAAQRAVEYWEADPKATIEVTNMHTPRMVVKDPTTLYPAIEEAIRAADGWASKLFLKAHTKLSDGPLNRVLNAMKKDKRIKEVWKSHNPNHTDPRVIPREAPYWEIA